MCYVLISVSHNKEKRGTKSLPSGVVCRIINRYNQYFEKKIMQLKVLICSLKQEINLFFLSLFIATQASQAGKKLFTYILSRSAKIVLEASEICQKNSYWNHNFESLNVGGGIL